MSKQPSVAAVLGLWERLLPAGQGLYYLATGLWPLFSRASFERVTGRKRDFWLVRTIGLLLSAVGSSLLVGAWESGGRRARTVLGLGSAGALAGVDFYYSMRGRVPRAYFIEGLAELTLVLGWLAGLVARAARR
ncbi:MAG: hypothetical protein ACYC4L_12815 [Chloroflexota bacterium]